jgi:hypothetical protein
MGFLMRLGVGDEAGVRVMRLESAMLCLQLWRTHECVRHSSMQNSCIHYSGVHDSSLRSKRLHHDTGLYAD